MTVNSPPTVKIHTQDHRYSFEIPDGEFVVVGRDPKRASVVISNPFVSRVHLRFRNEAGFCTVEDLGTRSRFSLNGQGVDRVRRGLCPGDEVMLSGGVIVVDQARTEAPTEQEWLRGNVPRLMLDYLRGRTSNRKLQFFTTACYQRSGLLLWEAARRAAVGEAWEVAWDALYAEGEANDRENRAQAALLLDVFGNPFRLAQVNPHWLAWNEGTIPKIARSIYDARAFEDLPILADALLDSGCDDEAIISHCRTPGPHVRGCWVIDLLLGKE